MGERVQSSTVMPTSKKVSERTCVACRVKRPRVELLRIVRGRDSQGVLLDESGRLPGRGAWLCRDDACFDAIRDGKRLGRALKTRVNEQEVSELLLCATAAMTTRDT